MIIEYAVLFGLCGVIVDGIWLKFSVPLLYQPLLGHLFATHLTWSAIVIFYCLYAYGVAYFVICPTISVPIVSIQKLIKSAFLFGFVAYGAYDLTNQATLKNWPWIITIIDMLWGGIMTAVSARGAVYLSLGL